MNQPACLIDLLISIAAICPIVSQLLFVVDDEYELAPEPGWSLFCRPALDFSRGKPQF